MISGFALSAKPLLLSEPLTFRGETLKIQIHLQSIQVKTVLEKANVFLIKIIIKGMRFRVPREILKCAFSSLRMMSRASWTLTSLHDSILFPGGKMFSFFPFFFAVTEQKHKRSAAGAERASGSDGGGAAG